jgi:hypothetical protein
MKQGALEIPTRLKIMFNWDQMAHISLIKDREWVNGSPKKNTVHDRAGQTIDAQINSLARKYQ